MKQKAIRKAAKQKAGREKDTVQLYEKFAQMQRGWATRPAQPKP